MIAEERDFKAGETLFRERDPARYLGIVRHGEVDIVYHFHGGEERVVDTVVGGELLGWSALVEPHERTASAIARSAGRLVNLEGAGVRQLCEKDHTLGYRLLGQIARVLSSRLQGAQLQLAAGG
jgi:CRP-like cAMP-binding protein